MSLNLLEAPLESEKEDRFDRWRFAKTVYDLCLLQSVIGGLRLAIFGKWGEGKTTVLNYIDKLAKGDGHVVVRLSTWGGDSPQSLWEALEKAVSQAPPKETFKERVSRWARWLSSRPWMHRSSSLKVDAVREVGQLVFNRFVIPARRAIEVKLHLFKDKRLFVLIDDLDRAHASLVPQALMSLKNILELRRCIFILALDREIVSEALQIQHPEWKETGTDFLDKILDSAYPLPQPSSRHLKNLLHEQLHHLKDFADTEALESLWDLYSTNPRLLKRAVRHLNILKAQAVRHDPGELDWIALGCFSILESEYPGIMRLIAQEQPLIEALFLGLNKLDRGPEDQPGELKPHEKALVEFSESFPTSNTKRERLKSLLFKMAKRIPPIGPEELIYHASLFYQIPTVTRAEVRSIVREWKRDQTPEAMARFLEDLVKRSHVVMQDIMLDIWTASVFLREATLKDAADVRREAETKEHLTFASLILKWMQVLAIDCGGFGPPQPRLTGNEFMLLLGRVEKWAEWNEPDYYRSIRDEERSALISIAGSCAKPADLMEAMEPWVVPLPDDPQMYPANSELRRKILDQLRPKVADELLALFHERDGLSRLWGEEGKLAYRYVLFDLEQAFYRDPHRTKFLKLAEMARDESHIQDNFIEYTQMLAHGIGKEYGWGIISKDNFQKLARDSDVINAVLSAACVRPLQPRLQRSMNKYREILQRATQ